ncbi:hypothetical protein O3Q51_06005 [Cryomorphaceae bacterium 1068]|nr:hypothetical protein [Cryomorphaceae bacterium 1068]
MNTQIKSGKEILDEFFEDLKADEELNQETSETIINLYETGKLTDRNLTNALAELREKKENGKTK